MRIPNIYVGDIDAGLIIRYIEEQTAAREKQGSELMQQRLRLNRNFRPSFKRGKDERERKWFQPAIKNQGAPSFHLKVGAPGLNADG